MITRLFNPVTGGHKSQGVLVYGGQAGSEGKGKIAAYIALEGWINRIPTAAICAFMTNAGHTAIDKNGRKIVVQQIPIAAINPNTILMIGPGSAITLEQLKKEIDQLEELGLSVKERLIIHPRAVLIDQRHRDIEALVTKRVASTMKGCGAALADKALRHPEVRLVKDAIDEIESYGAMVADTQHFVRVHLDKGYLLVEGAQGFELDINIGISYPQCTSRSCHPTAISADCAIPLDAQLDTIAVVRTFPIRVGNIVEEGKMVGDSGPMGGKEMSWEEVAAVAGWNHLEERTTVTQRIRRVFTFDAERFMEMVRATRPDFIAINFLDYLSKEVFGAESIGAISREALTDDSAPLAIFIAELERNLNNNDKITAISHLGTGPLHHHMVNLDR